MKIFDATGAPAGRLASVIVKLILSGEQVAVVNVDKAVLSGNSSKIVDDYNARRRIQVKTDPAKSVKWPRRPDLLFKKITAGMMPKKTSRSKDALAKLKAYLGVPKELEGKPAEKRAKSFLCETITLMELCKRLGWQGGQ